MEKQLIFISHLLGALLIATGKKHLSIEYDLQEEYLEYIGYSDCNFINPNAKLLYYNVNIKTHEKYKSTITYGYLL
jgi:hypothetical protein